MKAKKSFSCSRYVLYHGWTRPGNVNPPWKWHKKALRLFCLGAFPHPGPLPEIFFRVLSGLRLNISSSEIIFSHLILNKSSPGLSLSHLFLFPHTTNHNSWLYICVFAHSTRVCLFTFVKEDKNNAYRCTTKIHCMN